MNKTKGSIHDEMRIASEKMQGIRANEYDPRVLPLVEEAIAAIEKVRIAFEQREAEVMRKAYGRG